MVALQILTVFLVVIVSKNRGSTIFCNHEVVLRGALSLSLPPQRAPVHRGLNPTRALLGEQHAPG